MAEDQSSVASPTRSLTSSDGTQTVYDDQLVRRKVESTRGTLLHPQRAERSTILTISLLYMGPHMCKPILVHACILPSTPIITIITLWAAHLTVRAVALSCGSAHGRIHPRAPVHTAAARLRPLPARGGTGVWGWGGLVETGVLPHRGQVTSPVAGHRHIST
ncbi:unnamed protein product [Pleuronectes platessa]|uniref:Uncharacterized protein n=1 Tax=Pleuronectes platessa TaxID=8262 RepID=A0A9N7TW18_PLEPL|nr:unnamed protein product [Pleuronectes platessa]